MLVEKWKLLLKIINTKNLSKSDVQVASAILEHHNNKTRETYPTNRRLVKITGLSLRQVQLSTAKLHSHKLVYKLSIKGKNHFKLTEKEFVTHANSYTSKPFTMNKPAPPTKPITYIDINKTIKKFAKNSNPYYKAVVNNGLSYHQNMENKYIRLMSKRLSRDQYSQWLVRLDNEQTKQDALSYAEKQCKLLNTT
jgi:AAA15 family ATPase/GTPase